MFSGNNNLLKLDTGDDFVISGVMDFIGIFNECQRLPKIDIIFSDT